MRLRLLQGQPTHHYAVRHVAIEVMSYDSVHNLPLPIVRKSGPVC